MALAQVARNAADDTFVVTLNAKAHKALKRWGDETAISKAKQLEDILAAFLQNKINDYRGLDGPTLVDKYDALTPAQQATVDAILATAVVVP